MRQKIKCENCIFCIVYEDQREDMRSPFPSCKKDHEILTLDTMDFVPATECGDFEEGEVEWC